MNKKSLEINEALVRHLINTQFPQLKDLPVSPVVPGGWDNRTFRLGSEMLVRMPSEEEYVAQVEKEYKWLPRLAPFLPLPISVPLAMGKPNSDYPWKWSIYRWLEGDTSASSNISNLCSFAAALAQFLAALHRIDSSDGPLSGPHNFYRGGSLSVYDMQTRQAISILNGKIDSKKVVKLWEKALDTVWQGAPVWIHGDLASGNLLVQNGRLSGVIDFGQMGVGDPACDLSIAWTLFEEESRKTFYQVLPLDSDTWIRGRAWTLWKALIVAAELVETNSIEAQQCWHIIDKVLEDN